MGNQSSAPSSSETATDRALRPFTRHVGGSLGLSRAELDKRATPSGLYNDCPWEDKAIRKLIADGRIAARLKGAEYRTTHVSDQECPICFLYYSEVNVTQCCNAHVCTECFLQVRPQKEKQATCPFCNSSKFTVSVAQKLSDDEIQNREKDEQTVIEARIRAEHGGGKSGEDVTVPIKKKSGASVAPDSSSFGSQLEKDERFQLLKKRSESMASNEGTRTPQKDAEVLQSIAMTPEERRRLEEEMRAQHNHPLSLQVEAEAQERRLQNEQAYYRSNSAGSNAWRSRRTADMFRSNSSNGAAATRRLRYRGGRDWNQIVENYEREQNGEVNSLDDLVVLEAAILLSMDEEARRERDGSRSEAAEHAGAGMPFVRSLLGGNNSNNRDNNREAEVDNGISTAAAAASDSSPSTLTETPAQAALRRLNATRRRQQMAVRAAARPRGMMAEATLDAASMMMRGISEEEQIAMAIAASLQEQNNGASNDAGNSDADGGDHNSSSAGDSSSSESSSNSEAENAGILTSRNTDNQSSSNAPSIPLSEANEVSENSNGDEASTITELARVVTDSGNSSTSGGEG